jgi:hypothetical protein
MSYRDGTFDDGDDVMAFLKTLGKTVLATALAAAPTYGLLAAEAAATNKPAPATKPVGGGALEVRAQTAFNRGEWSLALPMLKQVAADSKDNPDRLAAVQEQIRVCERQIAKAQSDAALLPPSAQQPTTQPTAEARRPHATPKPGQVTELAIKDLGNFDYDIEKGGNIPADVKALSGTKLRTHGFMIPLDQAESITEFALVPSLFACCFGQPPQIQHTLVVHCPKGKAVSYFPDEITVEGTLKVEEKKDDGYIVSVFEIDASSVKPAPK